MRTGRPTGAGSPSRAGMRPAASATTWPMPIRAMRSGAGSRRVGSLPVLTSTSPAVGEWWSPDGTELAVVSGAPRYRLGHEDVVVVKPDGSEPRVVAETAFNPAWSPDGKRIAFHRHGRTLGVLRRTARARLGPGSSMRTARTNVDSIRWSRVVLLRRSWSPDGTRLAGLLIVATPDDPNLGLHFGVMTVDGDDPQVALQDGDAGSWQPVVAPIPPAPSFETAAPSS